MPALMLVFAHAVHLITSTGKVTAALQGEQLPRKYFDLLSGKNSELVCSTAYKVAGGSVLLIHSGCRKVSKWH